MTAKELKRIFQKGECLSLDTMRLYIDGKLNKKSMHEVEKHLVECGLCSAAMDGLTPRRMAEINKLSSHIERRLAVYMNTPPRIPFFRKYAGTMIAAALVVGIGLTWWYFAHDSQDVKQHLNDTAAASGNTLNVTQATDANPIAAQVNGTNPVQDAGMISNPQEHAAGMNPQQQNSRTSDIPSADKNAQQNGSAPPENKTQQAPENKNPDPNSQAATTGPNSRNANAPLRIKNIQVYPPVTHSDKSSSKESKGGQISRSNGSNASFQLDEMPSYPGGDAALRTYIMNNFKPVTIDRSKVTRFSTGVLFIVNVKTGAISAPELSFSISPEADAELLRVIKAMPNWNPGKKRGEVDIMLGITFE